MADQCVLPVFPSWSLAALWFERIRSEGHHLWVSLRCFAQPKDVKGVSILVWAGGGARESPTWDSFWRGIFLFGLWKGCPRFSRGARRSSKPSFKLHLKHMARFTATVWNRRSHKSAKHGHGLSVDVCGCLWETGVSEQNLKLLYIN